MATAAKRSEHFNSVLGKGRGRELVAADFAYSRLSGSVASALDTLIEEVETGDLDNALLLIKDQANHCLGGDISAEHPGLARLRTAIANSLASTVLALWREPTRDFLHLAGVQPRHATCLLADPSNTIHLCPDGVLYASLADPFRLGRITKTVCDIFVNAHDFTPAERGSWGRETSRCRVCERSHSKQRHPTQKTSLSNALACVREIGESTNPDPLPKNWEIVVSEAEHHPYSLATAIEDRMRLILGDVSRGDYIYRWNADHLQHHANGIYTDALRVFSRNRVSANPELAVLRALDHPRLLFCDTVHARLVRPQLATNLERMKEAVVSGLFDGWVPSEPTPWTRRQFLTRCAAAANHVEDQLRYYSGSNDRKYYRRVAAPDMEAPSPTPPRVRKPKTN